MERNRNIPVKEFCCKFKSNDDIYRRFTIDRKLLLIMAIFAVVQYYLPSKRMWPLGFIRDIINGKKMASYITDF